MGLFEIAIALTALSTGFGIYSSVVTNNAAADQAEANARYQADALAKQAEQERIEQNARSLEARAQAKRKRAAIEAAYASSGVTIEGTPTMTLVNQAGTDEMETVMQESASGYKRRLLLTEADNALLLGNSQASSYRSAGVLGAIGSGLMGATQMATIGLANDATGATKSLSGTPKASATTAKMSSYASSLNYRTAIA